MFACINKDIPSIRSIIFFDQPEKKEKLFVQISNFLLQTLYHLVQKNQIHHSYVTFLHPIKSQF